MVFSISITNIGHTRADITGLTSKLDTVLPDMVLLIYIRRD